MFRFYDIDTLSDDFVKLVLREKVPANPEKGFVHAYKFDIYEIGSNIEVGFIDIRIGYNEGLYYGGHIGYTIFEAFRGNNYAQKSCELVKQVAILHHMNKLYITCNPDNVASRKTCENLGLSFIEIVNLPESNDMYQDGERQKCIYEWIL